MDRKHIPNTLTLARLVLAAAFFGVLNVYRYGDADGNDPIVLLIAGVLFGLAAVTDALDGYYARKWHVESVFGRIVDPFADKILILGAVIYLASPRFLDPAAVAAGSIHTMVSGVYPWMVVVVLARELLVTSIRGVAERMGVDFSAKKLGKWKMILQSTVVPVVIVIVAIDPARDGWGWLAWVRDALVYATVLVTVLSGLPYVAGALRVMRTDKSEAPEAGR
ncbi:MAG: CDP-alcohol phosphatidyltransferase family protein [Planctomycetota bacterium]